MVTAVMSRPMKLSFIAPSATLATLCTLSGDGAPESLVDVPHAPMMVNMGWMVRALAEMTAVSMSPHAVWRSTISP